MMTIKRIAFLCVLVTLCAPGQAKAFLGLFEGDQQQQAAPQVVLARIHDDATFAANTKPWHLVPFGDITLEFEIQLPKDWQIEADGTIEPPDLNKKIIAHVAKFGNPATETYRTFVTIEALKLEHEIDAKSWLKYHLLSSGHPPEGEVTAVGLTRAYAGYVAVNDGRDTYTYMTVQLSGNLAMVARFEMPLAYKDYLAYLQKKSLESFKLIYLKENEPIEQSNVFTLVDALKFSYPASWKISNQDFGDLNKLSVQLHNKGPNDILDGYIYFYAARRNADVNFMKAVDNVRTYFTGVMNLEFKKLASSKRLDNTKRFTFGQEEVYRVSYKKGGQKEQELKLIALADPDWYVFVVLMSPLEEHSPYMWARNNRSFDLVVGSFK